MQRPSRTKATVPVTGGSLAARPVRTTTGAVISLANIGRPDHVGLVFDRQIRTRGRHPTPGRFRTRVLTAGVTPSLHVDYKHSKIKQYHKLRHEVARSE